MGLFGNPIMCSECGEKTSLFSRRDFKDGASICGRCASLIPKWIDPELVENWDFPTFSALKKYLEYSETVLRPMFHETHRYEKLILDFDNGLFCVADNLLNAIKKDTVFLELKNLAGYEFQFQPEELQSGILSEKVKGKTAFSFTTLNPPVVAEFILSYDAKAKAKSNLFKTKVSYEMPKEMTEFESAFVMSLYMHMPSNPEENVEEKSSELKKALALFMYDSLEGIGEEELKAQRNRLIKAFHTDNDQSLSNQYAVKINTAYDILKKEIGG